MSPTIHEMRFYTFGKVPDLDARRERSCAPSRIALRITDSHCQACQAGVTYSKERGRELSSQWMTSAGEAAIWARLIESQPEGLTPEAARYLLRFRFTENDQSRLQELAERSQDGTLTEEEGREFDSYLHIGNLLAVMQSKARLVLGDSKATQPHS